jgi:hypothetical protein
LRQRIFASRVTVSFNTEMTSLVQSEEGVVSNCGTLLRAAFLVKARILSELMAREAVRDAIGAQMIGGAFSRNYASSFVVPSWRPS